jgi:DNA-binding response OmpR family regulator
MHSNIPKLHNVLAPCKNRKTMILTVVEEMISKTKNKAVPLSKKAVQKCNNKRDILLVEDSPILGDFFRNMLERNSYSVCTAVEENDAIDLASTAMPRLVLIDEAGCRQNALRISKRFKNSPGTKDIPLLLMLPADIYRHLRKQVKPYVDMCIPKTFTSTILLSSIQVLLSS